MADKCCIAVYEWPITNVGNDNRGLGSEDYIFVSDSRSGNICVSKADNNVGNDNRGLTNKGSEDYNFVSDSHNGNICVSPCRGGKELPHEL